MFFTANCIEKTKIKRKRPGLAHFFIKKSCFLIGACQVVCIFLVFCALMEYGLVLYLLMKRKTPKYIIARIRYLYFLLSFC